jgi:5-phospho-D-xylono-1,4-lactonase
VSIVRTVLGDVPASELGVCYAHEHIFIGRSFTTFVTPDFQIDDVGVATAELSDFHAAGGRAMVDSMPCDCGRNVASLAEISHASGVHIVAPTGLHLEKYYPPGHWSERLTAKQIAALFVAEIELGADANDYGGPQMERLPNRCGVIKVASSLGGLTDRERKIFEAAAIAHLQTGAPILTHTEQGTAALEQVEFFARHGVASSSLVLSHTDRKPDLSYHLEVLSTGVFLEYDSAFRWPQNESNPTLSLVVSLFAHGKGRQIMLGMDAARRSYWTHHGGHPGLSWLLTSFRKILLTGGLQPADLETIFIENPARAYGFSPHS